MTPANLPFIAHRDLPSFENLEGLAMPSHHHGGSAAFVILEGNPQLHEGSHADATFVTAEGQLCVTHDCTHEAAVAFGHDKKVQDANTASMPKFKRIIGRGTRIKEEFGKTYFTILDFRNVTDLFADPAFDGDSKPITTSLKDHACQLRTGQYASLDAFLSRWNSASRKHGLLDWNENYDCQMLIQLN